MTVKITQRIKGFKVVDETLERPATATSGSDGTASKAVNVVEMDESLQRPETLIGMTYKIKSPLFEHALYVTVNDIVLNAGTPHEQRRPFEIFINSKNTEHYAWTVALTRMISAVFRRGGDVSFVVVPPPAADETPVADADLQAWYESNASRYRAPEQVALEGRINDMLFGHH